ncbi:serine/threonine protein kinase [Kickxella alabastrina]|uniref:Serine/threonine protein kinase n=1 Tax=Kickxella alabastrina TaxID=61397 RepID=A0ACC1IFK4_9FUNG|nr:serine/threonine protein kinase [Kickxella alabastrina]
MTAGIKPPSPYASSHSQQMQPESQPHPIPIQSSSTAPKPISIPSTGTPIVIKRNTSFSQRIHNLLHRDKSQKSAAPIAASQPRMPGIATPTIAYRSSTSQTFSNDASVETSEAPSISNSPPYGVSPHGSSTNLAQDNAQVPSAYYAQRNFEPVPEDNVFAFSKVGLRTVQRHNNQLRQSMHESLNDPSSGMDAVCNKQNSQVTDSAIDEMTQAVRLASMEPSAASSREGSIFGMSREPSQHTLHRNQSTASMHAESPTPAAPEQESSGVSRPKEQVDEGEESTLADKVQMARPTAAEIAENKQRLTAGTTRDPTLTTADEPAPCAQKHDEAVPMKKPCPVYSTHKASLNQFGRQTKVIGKGTGGTVRLLQGAEINTRPPSLRSGPPSSHNGDEPATYAPCEHRLFAVKEFRKRQPDETPRAYMKKVTSEFCIGSSIHQENVIETLDLIFEGDHVYEIMEYCPHDLFTFVTMGGMDLDETFCWFKQVCQGVQYLHKIGIAHRDLKLENCLLTDRGVVKIIDFGCATVFKTPFQKEPSKVVGVCGSDPYIAPEVLNSRRQLPYYAQVADIWSVGIMYMCMTLLKFPWRIADMERDRNYGSYIRDWPRGREKLFTQLPKLRLDGQKVIEGMVYPETKGRLTMDQVMESEWMKDVEVCHSAIPAKSHTHHMKVE